MLNKDAEIEAPCPECGATLRVTLGQIQQEDTIVCPGCHKTITLADEITRALDKAMEVLRKKLNKDIGT